MSGKKLSVIIVSHNALPYLDLCLRSALNATKHVEREIILVDSASTEPVNNWVAEHFPEVEFIESKENLGFGKANNIGLEKASGNVILYLNPDTVISRDTIDKTLAIFEKDSSIGAIGVRMINGKGEFLPESKRSVPNIWSSFSRVFGLSSLFPKSRIFSGYRMGHIDQHSVADIEVLSGACMFIRVQQKELMKFDPDFFMYGEDIDLSYRISKAGYKLKYLGNTSILHFKGESTNKNYWTYHYWFYITMLIFREKHFKGFFQKFTNALLVPMIWFLMVLAYLIQKTKSEKKISNRDFSTYHVLGTITKKLKISLDKFSENAELKDLSESELIVVNIHETPPELIISCLEDKDKNQKLIFWNEALERFFGSY